MKTKYIFRAMGMLVIMTAMFLLSSCTKTADSNLTKEQLDDKDRNLEATAVDDKDLTESDNDLTTVDYKEFYDQLTPFGEWVQVKPEEIGMKPETAESRNPGNKSISIAGLLGVRDAYASTTENAGMVYVWRPSSSLAVTSVEGVTPVYAPYSNGKWVNTNAGWYFKANTPAEETTSHYGRWVNSPTAGWLWVPGRVWAPAWVDWKQNEKYVSWAPLPPSEYMVNGSMNQPVIDNNNYVIVEKKYFLEPDVYKYNNAYYGNDNKVAVSDLAGVLGLVLVDKLLMNRGPEVSVIQTIYGRNIELVNLQPVRTYSEVRYTDKEYYFYHPGFKRYKNKGNNKNWFTVNEPKSFKKYGDWKENKSYEKEYKKEVKEYNKDVKEYNKEVKKNEKEYKKEIKKVDDGKMYDKNKGKKDKGNDNGKKHDGNVKGKKQNDDGNKKGRK